MDTPLVPHPPAARRDSEPQQQKEEHAMASKSTTNGEAIAEAEQHLTEDVVGAAEILASLRTATAVMSDAEKASLIDPAHDPDVLRAQEERELEEKIARISALSLPSTNTADRSKNPSGPSMVSSWTATVDVAVLKQRCTTVVTRSQGVDCDDAKASVDALNRGAGRQQQAQTATQTHHDDGNTTGSHDTCGGALSRDVTAMATTSGGFQGFLRSAALLHTSAPGLDAPVKPLVDDAAPAFAIPSFSDAELSSSSIRELYIKRCFQASMGEYDPVAYSIVERVLREAHLSESAPEREHFEDQYEKAAAIPAEVKGRRTVATNTDGLEFYTADRSVLRKPPAKLLEQLPFIDPRYSSSSSASPESVGNATGQPQCGNEEPISCIEMDNDEAYARSRLVVANAEVRSLNLRSCYMSPMTVACLAPVIEACVNLELFHGAHSGIDTAAGKRLAVAFQRHFGLRDIDLSHNKSIGLAVAEALLRTATKSPRLHSIRLDGCPIPGPVIKKIERVTAANFQRVFSAASLFYAAELQRRKEQRRHMIASLKQSKHATAAAPTSVEKKETGGGVGDIADGQTEKSRFNVALPPASEKGIAAGRVSAISRYEAACKNEREGVAALLHQRNPADVNQSKEETLEEEVAVDAEVEAEAHASVWLCRWHTAFIEKNGREPNPADISADAEACAFFLAQEEDAVSVLRREHEARLERQRNAAKLEIERRRKAMEIEASRRPDPNVINALVKLRAAVHRYRYDIRSLLSLFEPAPTSRHQTGTTRLDTAGSGNNCGGDGEVESEQFLSPGIQYCSLDSFARVMYTVGLPELAADVATCRSIANHFAALSPAFDDMRSTQHSSETHQEGGNTKEDRGQGEALVAFPMVIAALRPHAVLQQVPVSSRYRYVPPVREHVEVSYEQRESEKVGVRAAVREVAGAQRSKSVAEEDMESITVPAAEPDTEAAANSFAARSSKTEGLADDDTKTTKAAPSNAGRDDFVKEGDRDGDREYIPLAEVEATPHWDNYDGGDFEEHPEHHVALAPREFIHFQDTLYDARHVVLDSCRSLDPDLLGVVPSDTFSLGVSAVLRRSKLDVRRWLRWAIPVARLGPIPKVGKEIENIPYGALLSLLCYRDDAQRAADETAKDGVFVPRVATTSGDSRAWHDAVPTRSLPMDAPSKTSTGQPSRVPPENAVDVHDFDVHPAELLKLVPVDCTFSL